MPGDEDFSPPACVASPSPGGSEVARFAAAAADYADASQASATRRAYQSAWRMFATWCAENGQAYEPASAGAVAAYLIDRADAGAKVSTLAMAVAAIRYKHRDQDWPLPESAALTKIWSGIRRKRAAPQRQVAALLTADLRRIVAKLPPGPAGVRDKALLLILFAGALRRSELVSLELESGGRVFSAHSIGFVHGGLKISLLRSKTDQEGRGTLIAIPTGKTKLCPVAALRAWVELAGLKNGPVFREVDRHGRIAQRPLSAGSVARIVKRSVARAGLNPEIFSGHSGRSGFVTQAYINGVPAEQIMKQTRHEKVETLRGYIREVDAFRGNPASKLGL